MTMTQESGSRPSCPDDVVFRHEPLPDVSSYIRLLKVVDVDKNRDIAVQCRLTIHNVKVDRIPPYYAISYTWGDPEPTTSIMVNGSRFEVRRNCENVLMQAKWVVDSHAHDQNDHHRYYVWCDAVCINQDDDEEKGHQVAMVGNVYQRAERVLACIYYDDRLHHHRTGPISTPRDEDEEFLFDVVRINEQYLHGVCDSLQAEDDLLLSGNWSAVAMLELAKRRNLKELENLVAQRLFEPKAQEQPSHIMMMTRLYKGIASLAKQDYFQRLWVYQELYLGEHVLLCCGKDRHVSLRALYPLVHVGLSYFAKVRTKFRSWYLLGDSFIPIIEAPRLDLALPLISAGAFHPRLTNNPKARKMPLDALLRIGVRLHCKDQRDKIYGILSMVYWGDDVVPIYPDYKLDAFDLAVTVVAKLQALLSHGIETSSYIHDNAVPAMEDQKFREIMEPLAVLMRLQDQPSERLARAVQERQRSSPAPMRTVPNESLVCNNKWWTEKPRNPLMLACLGFSTQRTGNKWTLESASPSDIWHAHVMRESKDLKDEMDLFLPPFTQTGDICLIPGTPAEKGMILIARPHDHHSNDNKATGGDFDVAPRAYYDIIGKGCISRSLVTDLDHSKAECWDVVFDAEDLMVLTCSMIRLTGTNEIESENIPDYVRTRVCRYPGSSIAVRRSEKTITTVNNARDDLQGDDMESPWGRMYEYRYRQWTGSFYSLLWTR